MKILSEKDKVIENERGKLKITKHYENRTKDDFSVESYETTKEYLSEDYSRVKRITRIIENGVEQRIIEYSSVKKEKEGRVFYRGKKIYTDGKVVFDHNVKKIMLLKKYPYCVS